MVDLFEKWKQGLDKTRKITFGRIANLFGVTQINSDLWDEMEGILLQADLGVESTQLIIESLKMEVQKNGLTKSSELQDYLKEELIRLLDPSPALEIWDRKPAVILLVGVNGSGNTTSAAKLAKKFNYQGKKVLLTAADTFRAAAVDQLQVWGDRLNIPVIAGQPNADSGAVAYDGVQAAIARNMDVVMIDTAGRLHTRYNLMEELKKVYRVIGKALPGAPHAVWLVLDATTGQNALHQARIFKDAVNVTGIILAKLDSSARGGMAFAIQRELKIPILFAGLGEKPEDIEPFDRDKFVRGILDS